MSSSRFSQESGQYDDDDSEIDTLFDEAGHSLPCYIENYLELHGVLYLLLLPIDSPIVILAEDENDKANEESLTVIVEDGDEISEIFADAKAVLAELNLTLKHSAYTLTASGELPPLEEDNIISLELDEENNDLDSEELQFLASFYHHEQKYNVCTPLEPLLLVAQKNQLGDLKLMSSEDRGFSSILEELLFDEDLLFDESE